MKKIFCLLLIAYCLLTAGIASAQTYDEQVEQYIAQYKAIAIEEMQRARKAPLHVVI